MKDKHNKPTCPYKIIDMGKSGDIPLFNEEDLEKAQPKLHARFEQRGMQIQELEDKTRIFMDLYQDHEEHINKLMKDSCNYYQHLQNLDSTVDKLTYSNIITAGTLVAYIILDLFII